MAHELLTDRIIDADYWGNTWRGYKLLPGATYEKNGKLYVALRVGTLFHSIEAKAFTHEDGTVTHGLLDGHDSGYVYQPLEPGVSFADVENASYVKDTGTYWLIAHCSPDEQIGFAAEIRTFARSQFDEVVHDAFFKYCEASNRAARTKAQDRLEALKNFAAAVGKSAHDTVIAADLGYYHRDVHKDWHRALTKDAVTAVLAAWKTKGLTNKSVRDQRALALSAATAVQTAMSTEHTIKTRAAKAAKK